MLTHFFIVSARPLDRPWHFQIKKAGTGETFLSRTRLWRGCSRVGEATRNPLLNPSLLRLSPGCASLRALRSKVWSACSRMWSLSKAQSSLCQDLVVMCIIFRRFESLTKLELCVSLPIAAVIPLRLPEWLDPSLRGLFFLLPETRVLSVDGTRDSTHCTL